LEIVPGFGMSKNGSHLHPVTGERGVLPNIPMNAGNFFKAK